MLGCVRGDYAGIWVAPQLLLTWYFELKNGLWASGGVFMLFVAPWYSGVGEWAAFTRKTKTVARATACRKKKI